MTNLLILISKNPKKLLKSHKIFMFISFLKKIARRLDIEDGNFIPQFGAPRFVFILSGDVKLGWILKRCRSSE